MRPHYVWVILRKEFLEALRDRRTLFILIVLPILLYPLLVTLISRLQDSQEAEQKARASKVALWGELPAEVRQRLEQDGKLVFAEWTGAPPALKESLATGALAPPAKPPSLKSSLIHRTGASARFVSLRIWLPSVCLRGGSYQSY